MIEINLLPKEYRKRTNVLSFDKKVIYLGVAAAALVVILGGLTFYQRHQLGKLDRLITKARMEENHYKKDIAVIDALTEVKEKILARVAAIEKLDQRRNFYLSMLEDLSSRLPEYTWLTGFNETSPGGAPQGASQPHRLQPGGKTSPALAAAQSKADTTAANPDQGNAEIDGFAYSLNSIGTFIIGLSKSEFFKNIKLNRAQAEEIGSVTAYNFKISCSLNYNAHLLLEEYDDSQEGMHISSTHGHDDESVDKGDLDDSYEEQ